MDIGALVDNATIAITGGSGTLGQALVRLLLNYRPKRVVVLSRSESRQAAMQREFPEAGPLRYFVGDVRDSRRLIEAFEGCQIVIHAAALKRVEVCEREPVEAMMTNVIGTLNAAQAAKQVGAERMLLVSSDKATAAATTYGACKYLSERLVIGFNNYRGGRAIRYSAVRYGNVLGSTGSVLETFRTANGTVPITDPRMSRFWWTAADAAAFVLSSLALARGGEVFLPKLKALSVTAMAEMLAPGREQQVIGLRGPEKLAETMVSADEAPWCYELADRYVLLPATPYWPASLWPEAKRVPEGWVYSSATAPVLSEEEFREMVADAVR